MRMRMRFLLLLFAAGFSALGARAQGVGFASTDYTTGAEPKAVIAADFNGDGILDLAIANGSSDSVSVLLGKGDGTFSPKTDFATGGAPVALAAGDFNGDGKPDLIVANQGVSKVSVLLGNGDGTFAAKLDFATGASPSAIATGDFNGDAKLDAVTANVSGNSISILLGNGDGTLRANVDFATGNDPAAVLAGDFNADGKLDVATVSRTANTISVLNGNGDGTFAPKTDFATGSDPISLAAMDFNADAHLDLVTANRATSSNGASVLLGKSGGGFNPRTDLGTDTEPIAVTAADFNADGKADFLTANAGPVPGACDYYGYCSGGGYVPTMTLRLGKGDGTFGSLFRFALSGAVPGGAASGDFNSDGRIDLAIVNPQDNTVSVLLQSADRRFDPSSLLSAGYFGNVLDFGAFNPVGITGTPKNAILQSTGSFPLSVSSVTLAGAHAAEFSITSDTCTGANLPAGNSCTVGIALSPTSLFSKSASLVVADNGPGGSISVLLVGAAVPNAPLPQLSAPGLSFGGVLVGASSAPGSVSLGNGGGAPMNISSITASGDFSVSHNCGLSLSPGALCGIDVLFRPTATGSRNGTLTITDNAAGSPHTAVLTGTGTDFSIAPATGSSTSQTVTPGQTATYTLDFAPVSGFAGDVALTCSGAPPLAFCSVSPTLLQVSGVSPSSATVTISTTAPASAPPMARRGPPLSWPACAWTYYALWLAAITLLWLMARSPARQRAGFALAGMCLCALLSAACGGGGGGPVLKQSGTPPGTFAITVSASANGATRTITLNLTVK